MAKGIKEKKAGCCEYQYGDTSYCGRKIDKRYQDKEGRNYCIFHSHNDDKEEEFYKLINEKINKANLDVQKAIDDINRKETGEKTRNEKIEGIRKDKQLDFYGFYFPGAIYFLHRIFESDICFRKANFSETVSFYRATFSGETDFDKVTFSNEADFSVVTFKRKSSFSGAVFNMEAYFISATFNKEVYFDVATFKGEAVFIETDFIENVYFDGATLNKTHFSGINIRRASFDRASLNLCYIDDIQYSERTMEGIFIDTFTANTNRIFARDAADYNYLRQRRRDLFQPWRDLRYFLKHRKRFNPLLIVQLPFSILKMILFSLWGLSSNFGRWFFLWLLWCLAIAIVFGYIYDTKLDGELLYEPHIKNMIVKIDDNHSVIEKYQTEIPSFAPYYYSIVTFTTLGFGDVIPVTDRARWYVAAEVVAGYLMLGALISILANKFARRA